MKYLNLLLLFCTSIIFCSCTITKRHFGNGYHIEWKRKYQESAPEPNTVEEISRQNYEEESTDLVAHIREPEKPVEVQVQKTDSVSEENNPSLIPQTEEMILREKSIPSEIREAPVKPSRNPQHR
ncbi:hypothetical protein [Fluviicola sp.]|uniref:hypothetical protein n=1 Tax=Fluviicola sp. TaxID=1917219 RepID=UPI003D277AD3